jgi:coatomer protein complex subunit alpha (xenin)
MLSKFEHKSLRVKSIAFHPKRPWVLACLHNGQSEVWDYELKVQLQKYADHDGPVRAGCFHPSQPLFATGGDDAKVRVYNYRTRKLLFVLVGHVDYVRSVQFHPGDLPWLVSASDDQTVRVWNWQSRSCLTTLTGHTHYVMSAQFHPRENLLVTASLDQTVRVWDLSSVRRRQSAAQKTATTTASSGQGIGGYPGMLSPRSPGQIELFSSSEGHVKFILEGHDRGVNWACFHPSKSAVASASDDRSVKLWRYNEVRAWEVDTLRGHTNNVNMVLFHGDALLLSVAEDKSCRVWDVSNLANSSKASSSSKHAASALHVFKREDARYWAVAASPCSAYLGLAHDGGFQVFKLERERPAVCLGTDEHSVHYVRGGQLRFMDLLDPREQTLMALEPRRSYGGHSLHHSPAERAHLLSNRSSFELYVDLKRVAIFSGSGLAVFVGKSRFLTVNVQDANVLELRGLDGNTLRTIRAPFAVHRCFPSTAGTCLLADAKGALGSLDVALGTFVPIAPVIGSSTLLEDAVHLCVWSGDRSLLAVASKHQLCLLERQDSSSFVVLVKHREKASVIKGGSWDGRALFFYNTPTHLKYLLVFAAGEDDDDNSVGRRRRVDSGLVCSLSTTLYLIRVRGEEAFFADRAGGLQSLSLDPTEFQFKRALRSGDFDTVRAIVQSGALVGQSMIAYLKSDGFAGLALRFVSDPRMRFDLALDAQRPETALEALELLASSASPSVAHSPASNMNSMNNVNNTDTNASDIDELRPLWERLAEASWATGNVVVCEVAWRQARRLDKLVHVYLLTGQMDKLRDLGDELFDGGQHPQLAIWTKLYCQDWRGLALIMRTQPDLTLLAYLAAVRSGDRQLIESLRAGNEAIDPLSSSSSSSSSSSILQPVNPQTDPWPLLNAATAQDLEMWVVADNKIERDKKLGQQERGVEEEEDLISRQLEHLDIDHQSGKKTDHPTAPMGWQTEEYDMDLGLDQTLTAKDEEEAEVELLIASQKESIIPFHKVEEDEQPTEEDLLRSSQVPFVQLALGSRSKALGLLEQQVALAELNERLERVIADVQGRCRQPDGTLRMDTFGDVIPVISYDDLCLLLDKALALTTAGKFPEAVEAFRDVLARTLFAKARTPGEADAIMQEVVPTCRDYILGLSMELLRRQPQSPESSTADSDIVRQLELSCYFANMPRLTAEHRTLALRSAMLLAYKHQCHRLAADLAQRLQGLEGVSEQVLPQVSIPSSFHLHVCICICECRPKRSWPSPTSTVDWTA